MTFLFDHRMLCLFLTAIATTTMASAEETSLWDVIPGVAQIKSVFQLIAADPSGAAKTQMNFLNEGLGTSQLRSAYFMVTGERKKAAEVQGKFFSNLEGLADALPVVGHVKGAIHLLAGDNEHGWNALKSATSSAGTLLGAAMLGPIGALGGHLLTDTAISVGDFALNGNKSRPHGVLDYFVNINKKKSGEHFDALAGMALDGWGGHQARAKTDSFMKAKSDSHQPVGVSWTRQETGAPGKVLATHDALEGSRHHTSAKWRQIVKEALTRRGLIRGDELPHTLFDKQAIPRIQSARELGGKKSPDVRVEDVPEKPLPIYSNDALRKTIYHKANANKAQKFYDSISNDPKYADFNMDSRFQAQLEKRNFRGLNAYVNDNALSKLDLDQLKSNLDYLTDHEKSLLTRNDFRTVNTGLIEADSTLSTLAGILGEDVKAVIKRLENKPSSPYNPELDNLPSTHLKELVKRGKIEYSVSEELNGLTTLNDFIKDNAKSMENKHCILSEKSAVGPSGVDTYVLKMKETESFPAHAQVLIDYNTPGFLKKDVPNPYRVTTFVKNPNSIFKVYAIDVINDKIQN